MLIAVNQKSIIEFLIISVYIIVNQNLYILNSKWQITNGNSWYSQWIGSLNGAKQNL